MGSESAPNRKLIAFLFFLRFRRRNRITFKGSKRITKRILGTGVFNLGVLLARIRVNFSNPILVNGSLQWSFESTSATRFCPSDELGLLDTNFNRTFSNAMGSILGHLILFVVVMVLLFGSPAIKTILSAVQYGGHIPVTVEYESSGGQLSPTIQHRLLVVRTKSSLLIAPVPANAKSIEIPLKNVRRISNTADSFLEEIAGSSE